MPIFKNNLPPTQSSSESRSVESVREWRQAIEEFFNEDWPKLTNLISSIEESLWDDDIPEIRTNMPDENHHISLAAQTSHATNSEVENHRTNVPIAAEPEQQRRLEELALKIEERLKKTTVH